MKRFNYNHKTGSVTSNQQKTEQSKQTQQTSKHLKTTNKPNSPGFESRRVHILKENI